MTDEFASKVFPIILDVLDLLDSIRGGRRFREVFEVDRPRLKGELGRLATGKEEDELARRALVYWIDEVLVNTPWSEKKGSGEWNNKLLEHEFWESRHRGWMFFAKAREAASLGRPDTLETFYVCVALGFRGELRDPGSRSTAHAAEPAPQPPPPPSGAPAMPAGWATQAGSGAPPAAAVRPDETVGDTASTPQSEPGDPQGSAGDPRGSGAVHEQAGSLEEWADRVLPQIRPRRLNRYQPKLSPDAAGDCAPLRGWRSLQQLLAALGMMLAGTFVLLGFWLLM